jgi:hypothetical protein
MTTKYALLIGINYINNPSMTLQGCWADVYDMEEYIMTKLGFKRENICIMVDTPESVKTPLYPTTNNIVNTISQIMKRLKQGDFLLTHYSGHGGQLPDKNGDEDDHFDECIYDVDFKPISDDTLREILVDNLPVGVTLRSIFDCCHSGTGLDLPWRYVPEFGKMRDSIYDSKKDVIAISACLDTQSAEDDYIDGKFRGSLSYFVLDILNDRPKGWDWKDLVRTLQYIMHKKGYKQIPQLSMIDPTILSKPIDI